MSSCPGCDGPIDGVSADGPYSSTVYPCGCDIYDVPARELFERASTRSRARKLLADGAGVTLHDLNAGLRDTLFALRSLEVHEDGSPRKADIREELSSKRGDDPVPVQTVYTYLDALIEHGLVERETHPDDGRIRLFSTTEAARELIRGWVRQRAHSVDIGTEVLIDV